MVTLSYVLLYLHVKKKHNYYKFPIVILLFQPFFNLAFNYYNYNQIAIFMSDV